MCHLCQSLEEISAFIAETPRDSYIGDVMLSLCMNESEESIQRVGEMDLDERTQAALFGAHLEELGHKLKTLSVTVKQELQDKDTAWCIDKLNRYTLKSRGMDESVMQVLFDLFGRNEEQSPPPMDPRVN